MSEERRQILSVDFEELAAFLRLPEGHTIERVNIRDYPFAPGILVTVHGDAMADYGINAPLYIEPIARFHAEANERMDHRAPLECGCKRVDFGCASRSVSGFVYDPAINRHVRITAEQERGFGYG